MRFRTLHHTWAWLNGYFWMPCPLCSQEFGGHEWRVIDGKIPQIPTPGHSVGAMTAICPDCTRAGRGHRQIDAEGGNVMEADALTAFRQWDGLIAGDHDHLASCDDTHIYQIINPFRGRTIFWIQCKHAFTAEFEPTKTIRP